MPIVVRMQNSIFDKIGDYRVRKEGGSQVGMEPVRSFKFYHV
jgi:hypothetical protein